MTPQTHKQIRAPHTAQYMLTIQGAQTRVEKGVSRPGWAQSPSQMVLSWCSTDVYLVNPLCAPELVYAFPESSTYSCS